jgi:hypothetical protein
VRTNNDGGWTLRVRLTGVQDRNDVYDTALGAKSHAELLTQAWVDMAFGNDQ